MKKVFSWDIIDDDILVKNMDKTFYEEGSTGIPIILRSFFECEDVWQFKERDINIWYKTKKYIAKIQTYLEKPIRTRLFLKNLFSRNKEDIINNKKAVIKKINKNNYCIDFVKSLNDVNFDEENCNFIDDNDGKENNNTMIYLDNAATTFPKPECVYEALDNANRNYGFNSGRGGYKKAKEVSKIIDNTRELLSEYVETDKENVIFMPSSTISLNAIIFGLNWKEGDYVFVSPFEHNAIMRPLEEIRKRYKIIIEIIPFDNKTWKVSEDLEDLFVLKKPKCIFCSARSNVTGYNLPYNEIFKVAKKYDAITVLDASQSFGVEEIDNNNLDFVVFAGHKSLYASFGIAGFINIHNLKLKNHIFGGTGSDSLNLNMPSDGTTRFEAGSMNIIAICGLNESLKWLKENNVKQKEKELFSYFCDKIETVRNAIVYLPENKNSCSGIVSINIDGYTSEEVGIILDEEYHICVRTGYHCCPLIHDFIGSKKYEGTVRISMNYFNTEKDIDTLIEALKTL